MAACGGGDTTVALSGVPRPELSPAAIPAVLEGDPAGRFTTLLDCVALANVSAALIDPGPLTLFAPTDAAFAAAGVTCDPDSDLSAEEVQELARILQQHVTDNDIRFEPPEDYDPAAPPRGLELVVAGTSTVDSLLLDAPGTALVIQGGPSPTVARAGAPSTATAIVETDLVAPNGLIQVIDDLILPPPAADVPPPTSAPAPFG